MELPKCECFQTGEPSFTSLAKAQCSLVANAIGQTLIAGADEVSMCKTALPFIMELGIINMAVIIAIKGTAIEMGTEDAERETVRVLTGIEARVIALVNEVYAEARALGLTAETVAAMREKQVDGGGMQS